MVVVGAFGVEGRWFDSTSSRHVETLGKSFTRNCLYDVIWRPVAALLLKFDSCNSLLSHIHTLLVNILRCVRLYINRKYYIWTIIIIIHAPYYNQTLILPLRFVALGTCAAHTILWVRQKLLCATKVKGRCHNYNSTLWNCFGFCYTSIYNKVLCLNKSNKYHQKRQLIIALVKELVPCPWLLSGVLKTWRLLFPWRYCKLIHFSRVKRWISDRKEGRLRRGAK